MTNRTVTEYKDDLVQLLQDLQEDHGVMIEHIDCTWKRYRSKDGKLQAKLTDVLLPSELT